MLLNPDFINELQQSFAGDIRLDRAARVLYSTDGSMYQIEPLGVAIPKTQDDLQAAVELAAKYRIPILPRGAGSSLRGQAIGEALILDCARWLDQLVSIDPESHTAIVEPGLVLSTLNRAAAPFGLMFGPDPASAERATMGGVIGNNATGAHSILYGMSADHLVSADVMLADGSLETWDESNRTALAPTIARIREQYADAIRQSFPKSWRNSAGYRLNYLLPWSPSVPARWDAADYGLAATVYRPGSKVNLAGLLGGSEGTLAVIRRATVNLVPKPKHTILGLLSYSSIPEACEAVLPLLAFHPSAIELIPQMIIRLARGVPEYARQMSWMIGDPAAVLVVEFSGDRADHLREAVRKIGDVFVIAESPEEQARIWNVRKMGLGILDSRPQAARPAAFIEDCAVPVECLSEFIREIEKILAAHGTEGGIYAHASAGCLHIRPILDLRSGEGVRALRSIGEQVFALTARLGGSMSSEHGDGIVAGGWIEQTYGAEVTGAMRMLKRAADPHNLLNPHKLFDAPPMDAHLRYGEDFRVRPWKPELDFSRNGGLVTAIEQCNGQGVCRKDTGVMCPSFQATREEMHSTRGRANLLRALIRDSALAAPDSELHDAVADALDLCLACKGCKAECPSGVDMAKLKAAFQAEHYKTYRRPLRDYVFGYFHVVTAWLAPLASLVNFLAGLAPLRSLAAKVLELTPHRPLPRFTRKRAVPNRITDVVLNEAVLPDEARPAHGGTADRRVIYLADPFARHIEPEVEQAAFDILNVLGYEIILLPVLSAGTALISKGFIKAARRHAARVLTALRRIDPAGTLPVVGIEPPEIYALKHDYPDLLPEDAEDIRKRAANVWLLEEFAVRTSVFAAMRVAIMGNQNGGQGPAKIKFHPHCHQRAEGPSKDGLPNGVGATLEMLRVCGYDVELMETGCCGMAGTFGYEEEHYELSMKVGELKLFPLIRQIGGRQPAPDPDASSDAQERDPAPGIWIASSGAACRMQIEQGTGTQAEHPLVLAARVLCP